ncbi:MAG: biopolymer transporter ExbD [Myxococcales bacterium]|nr:MAG: biopolymer transporter ExbD [Myxococcales bacterium]
MAMSVGGDSEDGTISAINTTPLVDVMLVLLIIFLITVPVVVESTPVELPKESNIPTQTKPENVVLVATKEGQIYWNLKLVPNSDILFESLKQVAMQDPQPEVHVRGDVNARYEHVGRIVYTCQRAGITKLGFILEPGGS